MGENNTPTALKGCGVKTKSTMIHMKKPQMGLLQTAIDQASHENNSIKAMLFLAKNKQKSHVG